MPAFSAARGVTGEQTSTCGSVTKIGWSKKHHGHFNMRMTSVGAIKILSQKWWQKMDK